MKRLKYFMRKFRYNRKRSTLVGVLVLLCLSLTLGFAYLTTELNINGVVNISSSRWDIHFENIEIEEGSVEATTEPTISNDTTISFTATLNNPGDFYKFTTDIVNDGTYDAKIDSITLSPTLTSEEEEYFEYKIEYTEGGNIQVDDALDAGTSENITVLFKYKTNADSSVYPEEDTDFTVEVTITYVQGKGNEVNHTTLYSVLKDAASDGTYAREYTGEHHDSFTKEPSKKIYHWYGSNDTNGTAILDKNNVIFANHCWQMIRTTDTGGVKMIYNGEVEDGKCLSTRGTHVGYSPHTSQSLNSNYWYGTDYTYNSVTKTFKVSGTTEQVTWNATTGPNLIGKYTCKSTSEDGTCATLYLVESYYNTTSASVIPLNSNSNYSQFGTLRFNSICNSPADVGYMYNARYIGNSKTLPSTEEVLLVGHFRTTYWYAHDIVWGSPNANRYNLDNPYRVSSTANYPDLVGEYTFENVTQTYTDTSVYYIAAVDGSTYYYISLTNSGSHTLADFNYTYTYGDSYTDNGDGTYTINSPTTVNRSDWYTSYSNVGAGKYVCKNAVNNTCSDLWYTTATTDTKMTYISVANNYKYAKGFTWDGSKYILDNDTSVSFWNINDSTNITSINNAHYTCWNTTGECENISYIYYINGTTPYYINITNGKSVGDAINEMLHDNGVNQVNSMMKSGVDAWYRHFMLDYDDYIEDTIFCNDRSIHALNGWDPNGGSITGYLQFKEYNVTSDLSCTNTTDRFSTTNPSATLTYKVGLMSSPEMNILNNSNVRKTGQAYWIASPYYFYSYLANVHYVSNAGLISGSSVNAGDGVRPSVSLVPGTKYTSGTGSMNDPYIVE